MDADAPVRTACLTCGGQGHLHEPKMAIIGGQPQTVLAPRSCPDCGDRDEPGWRDGMVPPV